MKALYTDTVSCDSAGGGLSEWFDVLSGVRQGCTIAPNLFCSPMNWIFTQTIHQSMAGTTIGCEPFSDLDFADDVALFSEMLKIMEQEARPRGFEINWNKTKIQSTLDQQLATTMNVQVNRNLVEIVDSINRKGMYEALDMNIWRSSITLDTKFPLYNVYIIPAETWTVTLATQKKLNAFY
jgi:hypothetical protein